MITAQDIREKTFEKARVGGYEMGSVDDFLDQLAVELEAAHKENAVLKSKMKVLVDKIEEYRTNEEAAQRALLSAQKLAIQIEGDARNRAAAMLAEAERQVQAQIGSISQQARNEEDRLAAAKSATARYVRAAAEAFNRQLRSLENVSRGFMPEEAPAPAPVPVEEPAPAPAPVEEAEEPAPVPAPAPAGGIEDTLARLQALDSAPAEDEAPLTL